MKVADLSSKQARIRNWSEFLTIEGVEENIRAQISTTLELYRKVLASCWETETVDTSNSALIDQYEHELDSLNERIRLRTPRTLSREFEK